MISRSGFYIFIFVYLYCFFLQYYNKYNHTWSLSYSWTLFLNNDIWWHLETISFWQPCFILSLKPEVTSAWWNGEFSYHLVISGTQSPTKAHLLRRETSIASLQWMSNHAGYDTVYGYWKLAGRLLTLLNYVAGFSEIKIFHTVNSIRLLSLSDWLFCKHLQLQGNPNKTPYSHICFRMQHYAW